MYVAGEESEAAFDSKARPHDQGQDIAGVTCPMLIVQREFDELRHALVVGLDADRPYG
jgi:hypothetical protein